MVVPHYISNGRKPISNKPQCEETYGRKIVKSLFCTGIMFSSVFYVSHASAEGSVYADQQTKMLAVDSDVSGNVFGGRGYKNGNDEISGYTVSIENANIKKTDSWSGNVFGGTSTGNVNIENNAVTISNGEVAESVFGAYSEGAGKLSLSGNTVLINGNTVVSKSVLAAQSGNPATGDNMLAGNKVMMTGGTVKNSVFGADGINGTVTSNEVSLSGDAQVEINVFGGRVRDNSGDAMVAENRVTLSGSAQVTGTVWGGYSGGTGEVNNNRVTLEDGNESVNGDIYGGQSIGNGNVKNNTVEVKGGTVGSSVFGGSGDGSGSVKENSVTISGNAQLIQGVYGGRNRENGIVTDNTVTVNGGEIRNGIRGGSAKDGNAENNIIYLNGGTIGGHTYAGYSDNGEAKDNTIYLDGANGINITGAWLYGSNLDTNSNKASGNTLYIKNYTGQAQNIGKFQTIDLDLAGQTLTTDSAIVTLTENRITKLDDSAIHIHTGEEAIASTNSDLAQRYEIIKNNSGAGLTAENATYQNGQITVRQNGALQALYTVEWDDKDSIDLVRTEETEVVPGTETVNEGRLAMTDFLNAAGDFVLDRKLQCSLREDGSIPETCFYGAVSGGDLHHDLNGDKAWAHTTGTHWFIGIRSKLNEKEDTEKDINGALYVEAGWGNVDTHNRYARGDGDIHYYGIGVIGERKQKEGDWKGAYLQAHARIGRAFTDYNSHLKDGSGERLDYDKNSTYYGAGLEIGREWQYHPDYMLDSYLKYRWLHLNGFNAEMNGADYRLDDIDSHRTRLGTRLNYTAEKTSMPYIGIAWEHEFDGNARGRVMGYRLKDTSLKGDSGVLELGVKFVPSENSRWNYDFTLEGYVGQREGVMGNFVVNYLF